MTKANITQYDSTPSNNADINDINIAENCPASNINNAIRELMAHLKNVDTGSQALTALSVTGDLTVGDGHTIGDQSSNDNLLIKSSSGENIELDSNNGSHIFKKNGTENFRVNDDGEVRVTDNIVLSTAGKGIHLGVTSATASNLLEDYEEGTSTLSFSSSGSTFQYSYQIAFYTKIGRMVNLVCYMQLDGGGNSFSGNTVNITGLPFTSINNAGHQATSACRLRFVNLGTGFTYLMATVGSNTTTVSLLQCGDNVAPGTIGANQLSSSSGQVMFSLSYVSA